MKDLFRYRIHGGADEIGGNFIEVEYGGKKIFLDMGMPLSLPEDGPFSSREIGRRGTAELVEAGYLPDLPGLYSGRDKNILGILLSHPHKDHFGFIKRASPKIPIFMGEKTRTILEATAKFIKDYPTFSENIIYPVKDREIFRLGPFEITPYAVDHSAFDSYAFLIKAGGKSLFYSGDLRAHGRKAFLFDQLMRDLPHNIDHFLLEGTMMSRPREKTVKEMELVADFTRQMRRASGLVLVNTSAHNVDRLETIYYSAMASGRVLVMDNYSAYIYKAFGHEFLPGNDSRVRVFFPVRQCIAIKKERSFASKLDPFENLRIFADEIAAAPGKFVMLFRESMVRDFGNQGGRYIPLKALKGARHVYSMWDGYWEKMVQVHDFLSKNKIKNTPIHCSGHAYKKDLKRLLAAAQPKFAIPIHTENKRRDDFRKIYDKILTVNKIIWREI
ncbi:MAG: MBL fold metallo-hydrolase [bacterium]